MSSSFAKKSGVTKLSLDDGNCRFINIFHSSGFIVYTVVKSLVTVHKVLGIVIISAFKCFATNLKHVIR